MNQGTKLSEKSKLENEFISNFVFTAIYSPPGTIWAKQILKRWADMQSTNDARDVSFDFEILRESYEMSFRDAILGKKFTP